MRAIAVPGSNSETTRRDNLSALLREVHLAGPRSRSDLVALTGLNRSTVGDLVAELAGQGLVREQRGDSLGAPGRPSPTVHADSDGALVLAVSIAVHWLTVATVGLGCVVVERVRRDWSGEPPSLDRVLGDIHEMSRSLLARPGVHERLVGVGVAAVGPVRSRDGYVHFAPNLGWTAVPMAERIADLLDLGVPVMVRNQSDLGARAEHLRGAGVGVDDLVYLYCDVGVGAGIVSGGRPLVGARGYAGEVGHMTVDPEGSPCGCGSRGCWETVVGERALLRNAGHDPDGGVHEVDAVLRSAETGEPTAVAAVEALARPLGIGMAGLVNLFDPRVVVLGGLFARLAPLLMPGVETELAQRVLSVDREPVRVIPSRLGEDAPLLGAAERAFEPLLADPLRGFARVATVRDGGAMANV
ncbi:MAG: ROK family transcriptional regulator [Chloroflexi bacterium]|nr:ROK family transcriptional regulator [Chloroflexota bacterium]